MDTLAGLFEYIGIQTNTTETKVVTCVPGRAKTRLIDDVQQQLDMTHIAR